ncbi:hypothetical protein SO694_00176037 [Aureococcus anophagefferens]|uniref:Uncharacterized protein n=1 Tax=Aureococcus anophagefferens TaxID=44056 RepID=A0ABR1FGN7_AURAN
MERVALLAHLPLFHECRAGLLRVAESALDGSAAALDYAAAPGDLRQRGLDGSPADLDALYAAADAAAAPFAAALERCGDGFEAAARKPRSRAKAKAKADYATRSAPGASWLRDVLRASVVCDDEAAVLDAFRRLAANCDVAAVKNRFRRPALNGYRDVLVTVRVPAGGGVHLCEIQIHHKALRDAAAALGAPKTYAFFRDFCALAPAAAEKALDRLVDELIDVPRGELLTLNDLVMRTLVDYAESAPDLDRFARLLDCIGARAYAAKVRSRIDTLQQRDRDRHLWSHEAADYGAALCVSDGGADVGERVRRIEADLASLEGMEIPAKRARLDCLHDLALLHRAARRFDDARAYFSKALDAADACGGPARGVVRTDWAGLLQDRGDDDGALEAYRAALDVYVETFGAGDKLCATPLANLARALANVGDYVAAGAAQESEIPNFKGSDLGHFPLVSADFSTSDHLSERSRSVDVFSVAAVDRYAACLVIRERVFGPDHGSALAALAALGRARRLAGDAAGAEDCARRGVALRNAGGPSPDATLGFLRLARLLEAKGEAAEALVYFERALAAFEAVLGADHEDVGSVLNDAARCRRDARPRRRQRSCWSGAAARGPRPARRRRRRRAVEQPRARAGARGRRGRRRGGAAARAARCEAPLGQRHRVRTLFANLAHVLLSSDAPGVEDALNDLGETLRAAGLYEAAEPVYRRRGRHWTLSEDPAVAGCASTREREDLAARVDGAAAAAAAAAASAAASPAAEAPSGGAAVARGPRPSSGARRRRAAARPPLRGAFGATRGDDLLDGDVFGDLHDLEAHGLKACQRRLRRRRARRDADAAAGDIASWLARELGVDVDGDREGFDASAGAADYDAFANDTPVRTYDLSNARGGDDDGPMSDAEEASYQDALLGICMDLPMLRGRKAS